MGRSFTFDSTRGALAATTRGMIVEYIRYAIPAGNEQAFLAAYRDATTELRESPHCLRYEITRALEEPTKFIVRLEWDSLDGHLTGFRKAPSFASFFAKVRPYFEQIEEMNHYELTNVVMPAPPALP